MKWGSSGFESALNHRSEAPYSANPNEASTHPFSTTRSGRNRNWCLISPARPDMGVSIVMGVAQNGWFMMEIVVKWMIQAYPYFRKSPNASGSKPCPRYLLIAGFWIGRPVRIITTSPRSCHALFQVHQSRAVHQRWQLGTGNKEYA